MNESTDTSASVDNPASNGDAAGSGKPAKADFLQFLSGLAVQTLIHLGKVAYPESGLRRIDLPNARYSIDLLGILEEKTKGNLSPDESRYLKNVLFDLQTEYVKAAEAERDSKNQATPAGDGAPAAEKDKVEGGAS